MSSILCNRELDPGYLIVLNETMPALYVLGNVGVVLVLADDPAEPVLRVVADAVHHVLDQLINHAEVYGYVPR